MTEHVAPGAAGPEASTADGTAAPAAGGTGGPSVHGTRASAVRGTTVSAADGTGVSAAEVVARSGAHVVAASAAEVVAASAVGVFASVRERVLALHPGDEEGRMLRSAGLRTGGKFYAFATGPDVVVKLPALRVAELVGRGEGQPCETSPGRVMREWVRLPVVDVEPCLRAVLEARTFVVSLLDPRP